MLERGREELQRQLAGADAQLGLMQGRLGDAQSEIESLTTRLQLEQGRCGAAAVTVVVPGHTHWHMWPGGGAAAGAGALLFFMEGESLNQHTTTQQ
jgi:hypothetical protein